MQLFRDRRVSIIAPIALIAVVLIALLRLDCTTGDGAEPPPLIGVVGSPVRPTYIPPTATPEGFAPTPRPRPTIEGLTGTAEERDGQRRQDALVILNGLEQLRTRDGAFPSTGGNLQSLCVFVEVDAACALEEVLGQEPPFDPRGRGATNGYWYLSDGVTATVFIGFETEIPADQQCGNVHPGIEALELPYVVCPTLS